MLGTQINKNLYDLIGQRVTIEDPKNGPIEVTMTDIVAGSVLYEHFTGETATLPIEDFLKQYRPRKKFEGE
jgi:hypothetical protein